MDQYKRSKLLKNSKKLVIFDYLINISSKGWYFFINYA